MQPGTRLTILLSKGCNLYAVKTGTGWELEIVTPDAPPIRRELSARRVNTMLTALSQVDVDVSLRTDADPFLEDDRIYRADLDASIAAHDRNNQL